MHDLLGGQTLWNLGKETASQYGEELAFMLIIRLFERCANPPRWKSECLTGYSVEVSECGEMEVMVIAWLLSHAGPVTQTSNRCHYCHMGRRH